MDKLAMSKTRQALDEMDYIELLSEEWRILRVRFGSMCSYFFYAETQVIDCEIELAKSSQEFKPLKHHSCAIAAYGHMRSCLYFLEDIRSSHSIPLNKETEDWIGQVIKKIHRIQAHPNEFEKNKKITKTIMVHGSQIDGAEIIFPLWDQNLRKAEDRITIRVDVRADLNSLAELIENISAGLLQRYRNDKATKPHLLNR